MYSLCIACVEMYRLYTGYGMYRNFNYFFVFQKWSPVINKLSLKNVSLFCTFFLYPLGTFENQDVAVTVRRQPPPQALRFSHGRGERETSDW